MKVNPPHPEGEDVKMEFFCCAKEQTMTQVIRASRKFAALLLVALSMQGCTMLASIAKEKARQDCEQQRSIEDYQRCRGQAGLPAPDAK
jgi:hypothetical protein